MKLYCHFSRIIMIPWFSYCFTSANLRKHSAKNVQFYTSWNMFSSLGTCNVQHFWKTVSRSLKIRLENIYFFYFNPFIVKRFFTLFSDIWYTIKIKVECIFFANLKTLAIVSFRGMFCVIGAGIALRALTRHYIM